MDREDMIIKLRALMLDIIGVEIYHIDIDEDLRKKQSFDQGSEEILKESINENFHIDVDLSNLKPLTMDRIAGLIEKKYQDDPVVTEEQEETETMDLALLKMVMN